MNQPVLEFKNVTWTYEDMDHPALRDVSFTVDRGELVGIVGVNDAGKSTLCRLCNGLIPNSFIGQLTGDVLVNGQSIRDMETAALARSVGSVFSDPEAQMSQVTVLDELYFGPANLNRPKEEILAAASPSWSFWTSPNSGTAPPFSSPAANSSGWPLPPC